MRQAMVNLGAFVSDFPQHRVRDFYLLSLKRGLSPARRSIRANVKVAVQALTVACLPKQPIRSHGEA